MPSVLTTVLRPLFARQRCWRSAVCCAALLLTAVGCSRDEELNDSYGRISGQGGKAVGGLGALADMLRQRGHTVVARRALTPTVAESADVILWAPDSFDAPSQEAVDWFDDWMWSYPGRTLIFIGRDYSPREAYWDRVMPQAAAAPQAEMQRRRNEASIAERRKQTAATRTMCDWFEYVDEPSASIADFSGAWAQQFDPAQADIQLRKRLRPVLSFEPDADLLDEVLLAADYDDHPLLAVYSDSHWGADSRILFVANGSFLLNLPLVNHEHRKLARRLIDDLPPQSTVVVLESGSADPAILDHDPAPETPTGLEQFAIWPQNIVLLHLAAAGIIFCFARWPIFGRPRRPERPPVSDFGQHVTAVGELLEGTGAADYAVARHLQYHQSTQNQSSFGTALPRPPQEPPA